MPVAIKVTIKPGKLLIDGHWVDGSKNFQTINPATEDVLTEVVEASVADVDRAVHAARRAFEDRNGPWRKLSASERGRLIWKLADLVEKNIDELAELETLDNGKPIFESRYVELMVHPDHVEGARSLKPMHERQVFGRSVMLFENVDRGQLAAIGEVRTPSIAARNIVTDMGKSRLPVSKAWLAENS